MYPVDFAVILSDCSIKDISNNFLFIDIRMILAERFKARVKPGVENFSISDSYPQTAKGHYLENYL